MGRVSNGTPAAPGRAKLRLSWDELAFVTARHTHALNQDRIVQCVRLATDEEERAIRDAGLDFEGTPGLRWEGALWLVNVGLAWVNRDRLVGFGAFAPDACLRRIDGSEPAALVEAAA